MDVRFVKLREREADVFGIKQIVATIIGGGVLFMVGLFAYSKVGSSIDWLSGGQYINSSSYCTGTWNGSTCNSGSILDLPVDYAVNNATMANIKSNVTSGFDLGSIMLIIAAVAGVVAILFSAFG